MKLHRFIIDFSANVGKIRDKNLKNQIKNVLRLSVGDKVILGNARLEEAEARISAFGADFVEFEILSIKKNENESNNHVILYCSILKKENFELVAEKATEVGVKEIVPVVSQRTVKLNLNYERLNKIIKEASEQSGRGIVPILRQALKFEDAVKDAAKNDVNLFFDPSGKLGACPDRGREGSSHTSSLRDRQRVSASIGVFIGSEGGWSDKELKMAEEASFKIISLGKLTLRAETAAIVGVYMAVNF